MLDEVEVVVEVEVKVEVEVEVEPDAELDAAGVERIRRYKSPCGLASSFRRTFKMAFPAFCRGTKSSLQNSESA